MQFTKRSLGIAAVLLLGGAIIAVALNRASTMPPVSKPYTGNGFAVVELFTSEGCSSCPPADEAIRQAKDKYRDNVFVLGFHVDYWNRLGWTDPFSSKAYSSRQRAYAQVFKGEGVYTPEAVVNGKLSFTGSDVDRLNSTIQKFLQEAVNLPPLIQVLQQEGQRVEVSWKLNPSPNSSLNIALVQLQAETKVRNGENGGRTLHHVNIVRDLVTTGTAAGNGRVLLTLPKGMTAKDFEIIAYSQNNTTLAITGAAALLL